MKSFNFNNSYQHFKIAGTGKLSLLAVVVSILFTAGYLIYNSYIDAKKVHTSTTEIIRDQQLKRILLANMYSASQERTLILLKMTIEKDAFKLDDLNQNFSEQARRYITARDKMSLLPLTKRELTLLDQLKVKVNANVNKQIRVAELFIDEKQKEGIKELYDLAIPGQNEVLIQIRLMIDEYNKNSIEFIENMDLEFENNRDIYILFSAILLIIGSITITVMLTRISRKEEQKLSQALDELAEQKFALDQHAIVSITDMAGTITYANDRFCNISGYSREEIIGQNHRLVNSDDKDDAYWEEMYSTVSKGNVWSDVVHNKAKDGSHFWVDTTIVPFMGEDNTPRSYISIRTDITKRKLAEDKLRANEERFKDIADLLPAALYETDEHHKITYANRCALEMFGITENDLEKGLYSMDLFAPSENARVLQNTVRRISGEDLGVLEYQAIKKDGSTFSVFLYASCITKNNEVSGFRGVIVDISTHKQSELALRRSQKMDALGQLTGGIAHDFNNILNVILGNIELLQMQMPDDDNIQSRIQSILKSTKRAAELTRQLLSFSLHHAENVYASNINKFIEEMKTLLAYSITPQVEIEWHLAEDLWLTEITPGDFEDSLLNLVINARDAMCASGWLTIETKNTTVNDDNQAMHPDIKPGDYVQLTISDCGEGMTPEQIEHIFEPFYTSKAHGKGVGLGLAMVFGFMQRSKGYIVVDSEINVGSTFRLYFPRTNNSVQLVDTSIVQPAKNITQDNITILIVDDEEALLELTEELLSDLGYKVLVANNAKQALKLLKEEPNIDLMISDVIMPGGLNGYELLEQATAEFPDLKVLLASGYTEKIASSETHNRFSVNLIAKPYTYVELAEKVRDALDIDVH